MQVQDDAVPSGDVVPSRAGIVIIALSCALLIAVLGGFVEQFAVSVLRPSEGELTWISDLTLASALGVALYLWLHLRITRAALQEAERSAIVLNTQLGVAADIQHDLLPAVPPARHGISWAVSLAAAGRIGGDYYDFVEVDDRSRIFVIADISGKGIPAAMMLVFVRAVFRESVRATQDPGEIAARLARAIHANTGGTPYVTCIIAHIDEGAQRLTTTNAGHPRALLLALKPRVLDAGGPPAGVLPESSYATDAIDLHAGDRVLFVTDGVSERLVEPFAQVAAGLDRRLSAEALCTGIMRLTRGATSRPPAEDWDDDRTAAVLAVD